MKLIDQRELIIRCKNNDFRCLLSLQNGFINCNRGNAPLLENEWIAASLDGHAGPVRALAAVPDGRLASGSDDNTIRLWDARSAKELARLEDHADQVKALTVLPDGRLVSGSDDGTVRVWDVKTGQEITRLNLDYGACCVADFSARRLVVGDTGGHIHRLDIVD